MATPMLQLRCGSAERRRPRQSGVSQIVETEVRAAHRSPSDVPDPVERAWGHRLLPYAGEQPPVPARRSEPFEVVAEEVSDVRWNVEKTLTGLRLSNCSDAFWSCVETLAYPSRSPMRGATVSETQEFPPDDTLIGHKVCDPPLAALSGRTASRVRTGRY